MLKSVTIRGFKSIRALEDFELHNLNVLIGANGAGKSNFISLFQMLAKLSEKRLQLFVGQQDGPDALLFGGRKRTQQLEATFVFDENGYEFALVPAGERLIFADETLSAGLAPEDVIVVSREQGESKFERLDLECLRDWLEDYALGDLWKMNILGGRPTR